jgi:hypothetical protein
MELDHFVYSKGALPLVLYDALKPHLDLGVTIVNVRAKHEALGVRSVYECL